MNGMFMRVVQQGEAFAVQSQKSENGQMMKCNIVLQEMGGKYENQYAAAMLGNMAQLDDGFIGNAQSRKLMFFFCHDS